MFLISLINKSGHVVAQMNSPLCRRETELILSGLGWQCQEFHDRAIWQKKGDGSIIKLAKVSPMSADEISRKLLEFESA